MPLNITQGPGSPPPQRMLSQGTSLVVQWLRRCAPSAGGVGSIPGQGAEIPHSTKCGRKVKKKKKKIVKECSDPNVSGKVEKTCFRRSTGQGLGELPFSSDVAPDMLT